MSPSDLARARPIKELASSTSPRAMMRASLLDIRPEPRRVVVPSSPRRVETGGFSLSVMRPPCAHRSFSRGGRIAFSEGSDEISLEFGRPPGTGGLYRGPTPILPNRGRERHGEGSRRARVAGGLASSGRAADALAGRAGVRVRG